MTHTYRIHSTPARDRVLTADMTRTAWVQVRTLMLAHRHAPKTLVADPEFMRIVNYLNKQMGMTVFSAACRLLHDERREIAERERARAALDAAKEELRKFREIAEQLPSVDDLKGIPTVVDGKVEWMK